MITFSILTFILLAAAIVSAFIILVCGAGALAAFGDLIVFGLIIAVLVKLFKKEK